MKPIYFISLFFSLLYIQSHVYTQSIFFKTKGQACYYLQQIDFKPVSMLWNDLDQNDKGKYWQYTISFSNEYSFDLNMTFYNFTVEKQSVYKDGTYISEDGNTKQEFWCSDILNVRINSNGYFELVLHKNSEYFDHEVMVYHIGNPNSNPIEYSIPILIDYTSIDKDQLKAALITVATLGGD